MTDVVAQVEQYECDEAMELSKKYKTAVQLQQEFDGEIEAHQLQERIDIEDEFDKATKVHDECLSAKQAQKLNNRLNK